MTKPKTKTKTAKTAKTVEKKTESKPSDVLKKIAEWCLERRLYFLLFAVPFIIMYIVYSVYKVHPYGENSVLVLDLNGQYVYFYEAFRDAFWGRGSFIYSWSRNLSGEMFGVFAYYLASPFMLIICLLPRTCMCGAIELMQLAKIGAAAVTFGIYLNKTSGDNKPKFTSVLTFSTMYALCTYMVVELMDPMWLDGLVYLPLIFWGVRRLIDDKVMLPYIIPLALMFIAHFYIGYMVGIFTFLYFVYYSFSHEGRILPKGYIGAIGRFVFGTFTALLASMWVLIPVYKSLSLGKMEFSEADFTIRSQFTLLEFTSKLFPFSYDTVRPEGLPMIYGGILAVILLPLFFLNSKISMKEKASHGLLLLSSVVIMYIAPIDIAMHGFQVPNWLPYRYSFIFTFFIIYMAFRAFQNLDGITTKELGAVFFGLIAFLVYLDGLGYEHFDKITVETLPEDVKKYTLGGVWFSAIAVGVGYALLYLVKKYNNVVVCTALCAAVCTELFINSYDTILRVNKDVGYSTYTSYQNYMIDTRATVEAVNEYDTTPFFRMESTHHRMVCDPIGTGYYGVSHSSSTMNTPALLALKKLGYAYGGNYTNYRGTTPITDAFFGIKYLMDWDDTYSGAFDVPKSYEKVISGAETGHGISVYENPYALGLGFAANNDICSYYFDENDPFVNQNNLFNYALGTLNEFTYTEYMQRIFPETIDTLNLATVGVSENHTKYFFEDASLGECHEDFVFTMPETSHMYMFFPTLYERRVNVWIKHDSVFADEDDSGFDFAGYFFTSDDYSILDLGEYVQGESVRVRISIPTDVGEAYWSDTLFYLFDNDAFVQAVDKLNENRWELTEFSETYLEGKITVASDQLMLTTIPYEEGWTIKVDGKTVEPVVIGETFIGVEMSAGTHTVSMRFLPRYFVISVILSVLGLLIMVMIFAFEYKNGVIVQKILRKMK